MKIYCIKFDGLPFRSEVFQIRDKVSGHLVRQIGGCATVETMTQMLTGKHSSELKSHGIGYTSWMDACEDVTKAVGPMPRPMCALPDWSWLKYTVPFQLNYRFEAMNPPTLCGCFGYQRYPDIYTRVDVPYDIVSQQKYINEIQASKENGFYVLNYEHAHEACERSSDKVDLDNRQKEACEYFLKTLELWNFNEPDALFWVFSDHGHWRSPELGGYPLEHNFVTWVVIKDNRRAKVLSMSNFIAATDFYEYVLFNNWPTHEFFVTEDCRLNIDTKNSTTAIVCKYINPVFKYVIYHEPDKKYVQKNYSCFDYTLTFMYESEVEESLVEQLRLNFDWV